MTSPLVHALNPSQWAEDLLGILLDPWQRDIVDSRDDRVILNCSRQSGKSLCMAVILANIAIFRPGSLCLALSPTLRQSNELFRTCMSLFDRLPSPPPMVEDTKTSVTLNNGSRVVSLPGTEANIRGFSKVTVLCIDEAARIHPDLYMSVLPMLAVSRGRLILASTPWGPNGVFHQTWIEPSPGWRKVLITADQCPRISKDFLDQERKRMGLFFEQEFCGKFLQSQNSVFDFDLIQSAMSNELEPLFFDVGSYQQVRRATPIAAEDFRGLTMDEPLVNILRDARLAFGG